MQITEIMKVPVTEKGTEITLPNLPQTRSMIHACNMHLAQHTRNYPHFFDTGLKNNCQVLALKLLLTGKYHVFGPSDIAKYIVTWSSSYNMTIKSIFS